MIFLILYWFKGFDDFSYKIKENIGDAPEENSILIRNLAKLFKKENEDRLDGPVGEDGEETISDQFDQGGLGKNVSKYKWSNYSYNLLNEWKFANLDTEPRKESNDVDLSVYSKYI